MGDLEFEGLGGGELRLGLIGLEWCVGVRSVSSGGCRQRRQHLNQVELVKVGLQGEETFREDSGFRSSERLGGEVND